MALIDDTELLALALGAEALASVAEAVRDVHREAVSAQIVSRLSVRYDIPSDWTAGADVKLCAAKLAAASILGRRGYQPGAAADPVRVAAQAAEAWLQLVVDGQALPTGWDALTSRRGPLVAGTDTGAWLWRRPGYGCSE